MDNVYSFAAARQAKKAQALTFPSFVLKTSGKRISQKARKAAEKRDAVRAAGKAWL